MPSPVPNTAVWDLGHLYISGLGITFGTTTTITVAQGQARDSTNLNDIVLARPPQNNLVPILTPFTVNSALNGAGGLDQGTIAASSTYYVYVIASSCNSAINLPPSPLGSMPVPPFTTPSPTSPVVQDGYYVQANVMISLSPTNPLLPFGYDMFRRIGTVSTDAGSLFIAFTQVASGNTRVVTFGGGGLAILTAGAQTGSYITIGSLAATVPSTALSVLLNVAFTPAIAGQSVSFQPFGGTGAYATVSGPVAAVAQTAQVTVPVGLNAGVPTVLYQNSAVGGATTVRLQGYVDQV